MFKSTRVSLAWAALGALAWLALAMPRPVLAGEGSSPDPAFAEALGREFELGAREATGIRTLSDFRWLLSSKARLDFDIKGFGLGDRIGALAPGKRTVRQALDDARAGVPGNWSWENGKLRLVRSEAREELPGAPAGEAVSAPAMAARAPRPSVSAPTPAVSKASANSPGSMGFAMPPRALGSASSEPAPAPSAPPSGSGSADPVSPKPPVVIPVIVPLGCQLGIWLNAPLRLGQSLDWLPKGSGRSSAGRVMAGLAAQSPWPPPEGGRAFVPSAASGLPDQESAAECQRALEHAGFIGPRSVFLGEGLGWAVLVSEPRSPSLDDLAPARDALALAGFPQAGMSDARLLVWSEGER